uniref:Uncharacterized protein n=1 Tax=Rhipicephalus appendiculatus TaxID=34631 RepID=A0A131Y9Z7_RHIAP
MAHSLFDLSILHLKFASTECVSLHQCYPTSFNNSWIFSLTMLLRRAKGSLWIRLLGRFLCVPRWCNVLHGDFCFHIVCHYNISLRMA